MLSRTKRNPVPYTDEETLYNFIDADEVDLVYGNLPDITLSIRKYPKRYTIAFEVTWNNPLEPWPNDAEEAASTYIDSKLYLWPERYIHSEFEINREQILNSIKLELCKRYIHPTAVITEWKGEIDLLNW